MIDNQIIQRKYAIDFIKNCTIDSKAMISACLNSHWHTNGFLKVILPYATMEETRHVLHIWYNKDKYNSFEWSDIHNHRWNFTSQILLGGYTNRIYQEKKTKTKTYGKYQYKKDSTGFLLLPLATVSLIQIDELECAVNSNYFMLANEIHSVGNIQSPLTVTYVIETYPAAETCSVYIPSEETRPIATTWERIELDTFQHIIYLILAALGVCRA